jgi:hypothetical protein
MILNAFLLRFTLTESEIDVERCVGQWGRFGGIAFDEEVCEEVGEGRDDGASLCCFFLPIYAPSTNPHLLLHFS